ncbi:MAG: DUF177 domain-containing protein [Flavobacteriales bacterium]|nr:DUF177 domain-containing protein [Flavobacteriales bacterium]
MKQDNSYELRYASLPLGVHAFDWALDHDFLEGHGADGLKHMRLTVALELEKKERLMNLAFHIKGTLTTPCDRCGEDVEIEMDQEDHLVVKLSHETDLTDDEVVFIDEAEHSFSVRQFIYEFIMVGLPLRSVHPEGACDPEVIRYLEEIDLEEGKKEDEEKETDPRWEALKKLKH